MDPLTRSAEGPLQQGAADIRAISPLHPTMAPLIESHLTLMRASSPACSVHAMDGAALAASGAHFYAVFDGVKPGPVAMGALKAITPEHAEVKSMHVISTARGTGVGAALLDHLLDVARDKGVTRVSLETGSQEAFAGARSFYAAAGFAECGPFEGYGPDPNSVFMTRNL